VVVACPGGYYEIDQMSAQVLSPQQGAVAFGQVLLQGRSTFGVYLNRTLAKLEYWYTVNTASGQFVYNPPHSFYQYCSCGEAEYRVFVFDSVRQQSTDSWAEGTYTSWQNSRDALDPDKREKGRTIWLLDRP